MKSWRKQFGIWVPDRKLSDERGFINPGVVGAIAGNRRRSSGGGSVNVGNESIMGSSGALSQNYMHFVAKFTAPQTGTITKIFMYSSNSASTADTKIGLYTDSGGVPNVPVSGSPVTFSDIGTWSLEWHEFSPVSLSVTSGSVYWWCVHNNQNNPVSYYGSGTGRYYLLSPWSSSWPSPISGTTNWGNTVSIYGQLDY